MRFIHSTHNHHPRRVPDEWVTVAETTLWGDRRNDVLTDPNTVEPYGTVEVECLRSPNTDLNTARYLLKMHCEHHALPHAVVCSRDDLHQLALDLLDAAQHAYPLELKRAGYNQCIAPWFDNDNTGGADQ